MKLNKKLNWLYEDSCYHYVHSVVACRELMDVKCVFVIIFIIIILIHPIRLSVSPNCSHLSGNKRFPLRDFIYAKSLKIISVRVGGSDVFNLG